MNKLSRFRQLIFVALDLVLINAAFILAIELRFIKQQDFGYTQIYFDNAIQISIIYMAVFYLSRVYRLVFTQKMWDEIKYCFVANFIAPVIVLLYAMIFTDRLPYSVYFLTVAIGTYLTIGMRIGLALVFSAYKKIRFGNSSGHRIKVLILGAGDVAANTIDEMKYKRRYNVVAALDDSDNKKGRFISGVKVCGTMEDIEKTVDDYDIEEICFCIKNIDASRKQEILKRCAKTGAKVKTIPTIYDIIDENVTVSNLKPVDIEDLLERNPADLNIDSVAKFIENKIVMVTGAGGSIGSELIRQMIRFKPAKIILVDIYENTTYELYCEVESKLSDIVYDVVIGSIANKDEIFGIVEKYRPQVILHAAAHKHVPLMENNPIRAFNNNVIGTRNVAFAAQEYGVEKFVMISSDKAVRPTNIMGATKRIAEMIIMQMNMNSDTVFTSVRFGNVLGSHGSVIPLFERQIKEGGPVTVTHKEVTRFFMTIPEATKLVLQAGALAVGGEIFMLDMGIPVKIDTLARNMIRLSGCEPDVDIKVEYTGLRPGEKLFEELSFSHETVMNTTIPEVFCLKNYESEHTDALEIVKNMQELKTHDAMRKAIWDIVPKYDESEDRKILNNLSEKVDN